MSRKCALCGKGPSTANLRSHSKIATKRRQYPNLQRKKINGKKTILCTKCLKTLTKAK